MQADMPCDEDVRSVCSVWRALMRLRAQLWTATNALDWERLMEHAPPPQRFLDALKSTLGRSPPTNLSACARAWSPV